MYGSASGFLITDCNNTPAIAKFAPTNTAIITLGILRSLIISIFPSDCPENKLLISSLNVIFTLPNFSEINIVANNSINDVIINTTLNYKFFKCYIYTT